MKLGRLVIAGMFLAGSTSASAGGPAFLDFDDFDVFTNHELRLKLNGVEQGGDGFKTKQGDIGAALCGRELENKEELVVYVPCLAGTDDIDSGLWVFTEVNIGVYNTETETPVAGCWNEDFDVFNPVVELDNDGNVKRIYVVTDGEIDPPGAIDPNDEVDVNIYGTLRVTYKTIKDDESLTDGKNCAHKAKFDAIFGYDDSGANDFIYRKGSGNAKNRQSLVGTEVIDPGMGG